MRVATAFSYQQAIANLQRRQEDLSQSQNRLTSGKRVLLPSDDPVAARRVERALAVEARVEATKRAAGGFYTPRLFSRRTRAMVRALAWLG